MAVINLSVTDTLPLTDEAPLQIVHYKAYFGTVEEADRYFSELLHGELWQYTTADRRLKALTSASQAVNHLRFVGYKLDPFQPLEFPRYGDLNTPVAVEQAVYEEALSLLRGNEPDTEYGGVFVTSRGFGKLNTNYDVKSTPEHVVAGITSRRAWLLLLPYLAPARSVIIRRGN